MNTRRNNHKGERVLAFLKEQPRTKYELESTFWNVSEDSSDLFKHSARQNLQKVISRLRERGMEIKLVGGKYVFRGVRDA